MTTYTLTITEEQAAVIAAASEVLARLGIGQFRSALEYLPLKKDWPDSTWHDDMDTIGRILATHTKYGVDGWGCSLSIGGKETSEQAKIAWDLYQVIRHRLAWERAVEGGIVPSLDSPRDWSRMMTVNFDEPFKSSEQPLATITAADVRGPDAN